ncbi:hypothetical protein [Adhaeretor mobilis]|uniref:Uncharacterized protein n=1 Tax=Adhaeretor mobilis TaxID=1930276 RepID=A0A517MUC8_9BACT|nr:hypothetical protein [Adhaeretor mobilis]QDS98485.1 hypothetical protein HG15A2_17650 [Adhaeretor mobilis]
MNRRSSLAITLLCTILALGCNDGGLERHDLYGKVTFKGEAVPFGTISFRPDRSKGGTGPAGFARILDGEYSTSSSGKGSVAGPVVVLIEGSAENKPLSPSLFPNYKTNIEVSGDSYEFDFNVPETAPQKVPRSRGKR